tara:strand:+ start:168 stop:389 length:222 start_codon:yes stop_codon:yes gene_type:complete
MEKKDVSLGDWLLVYVIMCIPLVNIVMLFVWAFGSGPVSKQNWAKASLIWMAIIFVLYFLFLGAFLGGLAGSL